MRDLSILTPGKRWPQEGTGEEELYLTLLRNPRQPALWKAEGQKRLLPPETTLPRITAQPTPRFLILPPKCEMASVMVSHPGGDTVTAALGHGSPCLSQKKSCEDI